MSPTLSKLAEAFAAAQGKLEPATKNAVNPHLKSKYADLKACLEAARPALSEHGLSLAQFPGRRDDGTITLTTVLLHASGEYIGQEAGVRLASETPQAIGSAITYLRRYGLSAVVGLSTEDDDAQVAQFVAPAPQPAARMIEAPRPAPSYSAQASASGGPACPKCGGNVWDNRQRKATIGPDGEPLMKASAPDFKCRDKDCGGVIWPPKSAKSKQEPVRPAPPPPDAELPDLDDSAF
jgi:pyruvate/2-oxoglutarate dehydrogenase complex dihydrolipoamide acyltransferase (E2) component